MLSTFFYSYTLTLTHTFSHTQKTETVLRTNEPGQLPASLLRAIPSGVASGGAAEGGGRPALSRRLAGGAIAPLNERRLESLFLSLVGLSLWVCGAGKNQDLI